MGGRQLQKFGVHGDYMSFTKSVKHDAGRQEVSGNPGDRDVFRVPGLRNVAETAPYFHDGSVAELNEAIRIMAKVQLNKDLSEDQIKKISSFLKACTGEVPAFAINK